MKKSYLILVVILSLIVIAIVAYLFMQPRETDTVIEKTPEEKIRETVLNNVSGDNFKITHIATNYARGEIDQDEVIKTIYLFSSNNDWRIIDILDGPISCEKVSRVGIPNSMAEDCLYQRPDAETPSEINSRTLEQLLAEGAFGIIGDISFGDDPSGGFTITDSSGQSVVINSGGYDTSGLNDGDYVVVDVVVEEGEDGELDFVLEDVEEVGGTSGDDNNDDENEVLYDISDLPPGQIPAEFYESLIDRDFSDEEVELISDY